MMRRQLYEMAVDVLGAATAGLIPAVLISDYPVRSRRKF